MCFLPWALKGRWHDTIQGLVEDWTGGVALEKTDLYGIRSYPGGATLTPHVDRETTHAASAIVNVAQYGVAEPWMLTVRDLETGADADVPMRPGEILFYESAAVIHGRPTPLRGDGYVNLFAHYRPAGDPQWFLTPTGAPPHDPALDIEPPFALGDARDDAGAAGFDGDDAPLRVTPLLATLRSRGSGEL